MIEHGADWRKDAAIVRGRRSVGAERAGRLLDHGLVDLGERHRSQARNDRFEEAALAARFQIAYGRADEGGRRLRSKDTTLDNFPLALRADRFGGFGVSNACAFAYSDASDGAVDVPVGAAGPADELEGHFRASYSAL